MKSCECQPGSCQVDQLNGGDPAVGRTISESAWRKLWKSCAERKRRGDEYLAQQEQQRQQEAKARAEARRIEDARLAELDTIEPVPFLRDLRETVLEISHTRCPKWRFKLAADFVVQIQPRPAERRDSYHLFEGLALMGAGIKPEHFKAKASRRDAGLMMLSFGIVDKDGRWQFVCSAWSRPKGEERDARFAILERFRAALENFAGTPADLMFSPSCLVCGKPLVDAVSMARMIGPECAHTSSLFAQQWTIRQPVTADLLL